MVSFPVSGHIPPRDSHRDESFESVHLTKDRAGECYKTLWCEVLSQIHELRMRDALRSAPFWYRVVYLHLGHTNYSFPRGSPLLQASFMECVQ
jgi:hypothetical protein